MTAAIEWGRLLQVVWVSLLAGVSVTALFSLVIYGSTRAAESRREGRGLAATAYGFFAVLAGLSVTAIVVFGIAVIVRK
jgi:uncharacterized membrane protein